MNHLIIIVLALYFLGILTISYFVGKRNTSNDAFFLGNKKSPWWVVAIGMVGASVSGVTFISVPGMVRDVDMTYLQMVIGYILGYIIVAYVLLPLYYRLNLTSIYTYLGNRFGTYSYHTGSAFFIISKVVGSSAKLYLVALILHTAVFQYYGVPFWLMIAIFILFIWIYTHRTGIKTIIWTDLLQTVCMILALVLIIWKVMQALDFSLSEASQAIRSNEHFRIFEFNDWFSKANFFKQFFSGILIVIVMTGLDQDMMQKNLTCKTLKESQKNMLTYGSAFLPVNFLFMCLGILLLIYASHFNIILPEKADNILPMLATSYLGLPVLIFFSIGIMAATFSSIDSALTSITTSICVDFFKVNELPDVKAKNRRVFTHIVVCFLFFITILIIHEIQQESVLQTILKAASYTYGPLLGLFTYGLLTKYEVRDRFVPYVCILAPVLCFVLEYILFQLYNYKVGTEILIANALFTMLGLVLLKQRRRA